MAKQAAVIEKMAGQKPHRGRQIALEIVTFLLFVLFMMPFIIVVMNSMRTNVEIINQPVGAPENPAQLFTNISDVWNNPNFNFLASLKDSKITPVELCEFSLKKGCRTNNEGTAWAFFPKVADEYGFSKYRKATSLADLKSCLDTGGYAVASMGPPFWTSGGHFICIWKYDGDYIYANDPASSKRTKQKITDFMKQRKCFFCFWR